ncbi:MAG: CopG family transcriptional regulator [Bacillota bacterium]
MSVRMQIYLPESLFAKLKKRAEKLKKPMSEQIRESLEAYFSKEEKLLPNSGDPVWHITGAGNGPGDLSERHDHYLYEEKSEREKS